MSKYPKYIDEIEPIEVYDELAEFLGAIEEGRYTVSYLEIVKMAGHSCATVAGAWLMAVEGLKALYGDEVPRRGEIKVELKYGVQQNHFGVVGMVLSNITGATVEEGFGGIPTGKFNRTKLMKFEADIDTDIRLTRLDSGKSVGVNYRPNRVVEPMKILKSAISPDAAVEDIESFPKRFQEMVESVFSNKDRVIEVTKL